MKKISAHLPNETNYALCNYMISDGKGYEAEAEEMKRVINASKDVNEACSKLNAHKWTYDKFEPSVRRIRNGYVIKATDSWGNISYIKVEENA